MKVESDDEKDVKTGEGISLEAFLEIHTGAANAKRRHLAVPLYMPLGEDVRFKTALKYVEPKLRKEVAAGSAELIAVAGGTLTVSEGPEKLQLVLFRSEDSYMIFNTISGDYEMAVLMDGDGRRYLSKDQLPREEAIRQWISGFLNWNCDYPGMYQLSYAAIAKPEAALN